MAQMSLLAQFYRAGGITGMVVMVPGCSSDSASSSAAAGVVIIDSPSPAPTDASGQIIPTGVIVQAGDSIGAGLGADWAAIDHLGFPGGVITHNVSVSGKSMQTGYGYRKTELFPFRSTTTPSVLLIQQGTNDLYYGTKADALYRSILTPFVAEARKAGFYVVVDTILPRSDSGWTAAMERERIAYNTLVRGNRAGADAVNDLAADPLIGDGNRSASASFYADGAHPSLAGQRQIAVLTATVVGSFLQRSVRPPSR